MSDLPRSDSPAPATGAAEPLASPDGRAGPSTVEVTMAKEGGTGAIVGLAAIEAGPETEPRRRMGLIAWFAIVWLVVVVLAALLAPVLPIADPDESIPSLARQGPTSEHIFGGDGNGRDLFARVIWGARASLIVSVGAVTAGILLGGFLGLVAGYFRGRLEGVITGAMDVMLAFPQLILALALVTFLRGDPSQEGGFRLPTELVLIVALGIVSTPLLGRISRASTLSWSQRDFVLAARAQGARNARIIVREVLPNVLPSIFSIALLGIAIVIVAEGGLSLLGLGVQLPTPSWGNIIALGRNDLRDAPHIVAVPSMAIFFTVLALNYLGDVVRARFDVRESGI